jgi:uncharacterized protein (UPF0261 family)
MHHACLPEAMSGSRLQASTASRRCCPGAIEVLVFKTVPTLSGRTLIRHSPQITDLRLNAAEMAEVGREVAKRLLHTKTDTVFLVPKAGYDSYATVGQGFHDPAADAAFVEALRAAAPPSVRIIERDAHIDDPAFATEAAQTLIALIQARKTSKAAAWR